MAKDKKSFIAYADWKDTFDKLPDDIAGKLIKHVFAYVNDENPLSDDYVIEAIFSNIKHTLKRDLDKWEKQLEQRRDAGKRSAEIRSTKINERSISLNETVRNSTDSVSVSVSVSDSDNVSDSEILLKKEPKKNIFDFRKSLIEYGFEENLVDDWLKVRKTKKATNTETAFRAFISEIESKYCDINEMLQMSVTNSWSGFKHIWVENLKNINNGNKFSNSSKSDSDIRKEINDSVDKYFA